MSGKCSVSAKMSHCRAPSITIPPIIVSRAAWPLSALCSSPVSAFGLFTRLPSTFVTLGWGWGLASLGLELLAIIPLVVVSGIAVRQSDRHTQSLAQANHGDG